MLIVLSPAKKMDFTPTDVAATTPRLAADTQNLAAVTRALTPAKIKSLMDLSDSLSALNYQRFQSFDWESTDAKAAILAFNGDVYQGLNAKTLDAAGLNTAQNRVRILSGFYGVLRPLDGVLPHRLEMGTRLKTTRGATLYDFWGDRIARQLAADVADHPHRMIVNCASREYFAAVDQTTLNVPVITCHFKQEKAGVVKTIGIYAKKARGQMARYAIDHGLEGPDGLKTFDTDGYGFVPALSSPSDWVFVRRL